MTSVVVIGSFPPPVHGAALATSFMANRLAEVADVSRADVSPDTLVKSWRYHLVRLRRVLAAAAKLAAAAFRPDRRLYFCIAGGAGVFYDLLLGALARLLRYDIFVHHHSFTYLNRHDPRTALLMRLLGPGVRHICLCDCMARLLRGRYPGIGPIELLSNAALMPATPIDKAPQVGQLTLGHLSNLFREKGLDTVLALFRQLRTAGLPVKLILAGPRPEPAAAALIDAALTEFGEALEYRGPVYGAAKTAFFRDIDVFLFPSRYPNEAQPLVLIEAFWAGVPVIANARGCIADDVTEGSGVVVPADDRFIDVAAAAIRNWLAAPATLAEASAAARARAERIYAEARADLDRIVGLIAGKGQPALSARTHVQPEPSA